MRRGTFGFEILGNPDSPLVAGTPSFITGLVVVATGTSVRALHCPPSGNATDKNCYVHVDGGAGTYGRAYFYRAHIAKTGTPAAGKALFLIRNHTHGMIVTGYVAVRLNDDNTLSLVVSNSSLDAVQVGARSAVALADGAVHRIELMVRPVSAGVVDCALRLDGSTVASGTSVAAAGMNNSTEVDFGRVAQATTSTSSTPYSWVDQTNVTVDVDNAAINDDLVPTGQTAGSLGAQDSYPGDGVVFTLKATGDSSNTGGWKTGAGGTTNLWDAVNNDPPIGSSSLTATSQIKTVIDATYRAAVETLNARSLTGTVVVAQPVANIAQTSDGSRPNAVLYLEAFSNPAGVEGTQTASGTVGVYPDGWSPILGPAVHAPTIDPTVAPVVSLRTVSNTETVYSDFMALTVELASPPLTRSLTMLV